MHYKDLIGNRKSLIQVSFDKKRKVFLLSAPIYRSHLTLPASVLTYVNARKDKHFRPYKVRFQLKNPYEVELIQEIPYQWGFQPTSRQIMLQFFLLAKKCHDMLHEIAAEDAIKSLRVG